MLLVPYNKIPGLLNFFIYPYVFDISLFTPDYLPLIRRQFPDLFASYRFFLINQVSNGIMNDPAKRRAARYWVFKLGSRIYVASKFFVVLDRVYLFSVAKFIFY